MQAFHALYNRYERQLFFYITTMVHDHHTAEDLFQDVWIKVVDKLSGFSFKGTFKNWVYTLAHHTVIDYIRKQKKEHTVSIDAPVGDEDGSTFHDLLESPEPHILEELTIKELHNAVRESLQHLSEEQREVFLLRCDADMKFKEIAALLDIPLNTVLGRMHYAIKKIRRYIEELKEDESAA